MIGDEFPTGGLLDQRQPIGGVAIDLVRAREDKAGVWAILPGRFQQIERAIGVNRKVDKWRLRRPIMRGLRRGMDNHRYICLVTLEEIEDCALIADVDVIMPVVGKLRFEAPPTPDRAGFGPKKLGTHVVVDADNVQSPGGKEARGLGPDQTRRPGDHRNSHPSYLLTSGSPPPPHGVHLTTRKYRRV